MSSAYILITATPGSERAVYYAFFHFPEVCEAHPLIGSYSLILKVKAASFETLGHIITDRISKVAGIASLEVLPVVETTKVQQVNEVLASPMA